MTGCTVFIAGMVTNVLNVKPAWIILAAVTEVVFFGVQFVLLLTALR